ncbi:hypothetical protein ACQY0O_006666 [Thecaphora frezii]
MPSATGQQHSERQRRQQQQQQLEANPAVSAFLSPKSRIFAGGHARAKAAKQLTPDEVANKVASMLKPGPPFFSKVSNADLLDFISDRSIMNCEALQAQVEADRQARMRQQAEAVFAVRTTQAERAWHDVGTVWSALEALPAGASWGRIPGGGEGAATVSAMGSAAEFEDDGLWSSLTLTCDIDCTEVKLGRSVVVPSQVLRDHHFFSGNSQALLKDIGAGIKYAWDDLRNVKNKAEAAVPTTSYLSLDAYTKPEKFSALWKWPSWMPFWGDKAKGETPATGDGSSGGGSGGGGDANQGKGQKRIWVPSTTKVSLHASWWGFSIYLPEAILGQLDGDVDEAEKIANLVNKCLNYILNNIPADLPAPLTTVITILKAIAPVTGYVSTFIGWSWDTIKSFDKGQGVVLSATWILPVALIPRSWDAPVAASVPASPKAPTVGLPGEASEIDTSGFGVREVGGEEEQIPQAPQTPVAAPGATLPPKDPTTEPLDLDPDASSGKNETYPGDKLGRGGDANQQPAMGTTPPPQNQTR